MSRANRNPPSNKASFKSQPKDRKHYSSDEEDDDDGDDSNYSRENDHLQNQSQFVNFQNPHNMNMAPPMNYMIKGDIFPKINSPFGMQMGGIPMGYDPLQSQFSQLAAMQNFTANDNEINELKNHIKALNEDLEREIENNKILEQKCEEYLSQLQRSADIIENTKEKCDMQVDRLKDELDSLENMLKNEQDKVLDIEEDNHRLIDELNTFKKISTGDSSEINALREALLLKDNEISDLKLKYGNSQNEIDSLEAEVNILKAEKKRCEADAQDFRGQAESLHDQLRAKDYDIQKINYHEESIKSQLTQCQERIYDLKHENDSLKQDKERMFNKLDSVITENESLRNEIYITKKMTLELEKRDVQIGRLASQQQYNNLPSDNYGSFGPAQVSRRPNRLEFNMEGLTANPQRSGAYDQRDYSRDARSEEFDVSSNRHRGSFAEKEVKNTVNVGHGNINKGVRFENKEKEDYYHLSKNGPNEYLIANLKAATKVSGKNNQSSMASNILTWNNPYTIQQDEIEQKKIEKEKNRKLESDYYNQKTFLEAAAQGLNKEKSYKGGLKKNNYLGDLDRSVGLDSPPRNINKSRIEERPSPGDFNSGSKSGIQQRSPQGYQNPKIPKKAPTTAPTIQLKESEITDLDRERKMIDGQLLELNLQIDKAKNELSSLSNYKPKTGTTMKKRREVEDRLELLEKQKNSIKSRMRMNLSKF